MTGLRRAPRAWLTVSGALALSILLAPSGCTAPGGPPEATPEPVPEPAGEPAVREDPGPADAQAPAPALDGEPDLHAREEVLEAVRTLFGGMSGKDRALLHSVLLPEARILTVPDLGGPEDWISGEEFVERVLAADEHLLERMFDPLVRIDGPLAHVWAAYDFWRDGEFSHCGSDSVDLIRTGGRWRIVAISFTLHPEELCPERDPPQGAR